MAEPLREASRTALGVAALRAAHLTLDAEPWILDDPIALRLLAPEALSMLMDEARLQHPVARALRAHVLLRSRVAEERLEEACAAGLRQCVILGAGFDTFAYRQPAWASALQIFEVDHPGSQEAKRARLAAAGIVSPPNLVHAPVDFERTPLDEGLRAAGFDASQPAFFSWLGVTMYLTLPAVRAVFRFIGALPRSSRVVLTFAQPEDDAASTLATMAASVGEPWITRFTPQALEAELRHAGFSVVHILEPEEARRRFFEGRADGLPAPRRATIAYAEV
ncbi:MAG: class I SAM-dependent methyltransferase [Acidobacteria bacterium]|nr:class I SAM-dependent methyltransferase [Acidobacteriota bacterium]